VNEQETVLHVPKGSERLSGQNRIRLLNIAFCGFFAAISIELGVLTLKHKAAVANPELATHQSPLPRPDIVDRNGVLILMKRWSCSQPLCRNLMRSHCVRS
jgi:cell division protein FtsI/penicillin-binding protein 2